MLRVVVILTGTFIFAAGAAIWNSLLVMVIGIGIALAGVLFGMADKARRALTDW